MRLIPLFVILILTQIFCIAQSNTSPKTIELLKTHSATNIQSGYTSYKAIALDIWGYAEIGFKEHKSTALLQDKLKENGFTIETGVAGMPTAFVATYGTGRPVI